MSTHAAQQAYERYAHLPAVSICVAEVASVIGGQPSWGAVQRILYSFQTERSEYWLLPQTPWAIQRYQENLAVLGRSLQADRRFNCRNGSSWFSVVVTPHQGSPHGALNYKAYATVAPDGSEFIRVLGRLVASLREAADSMNEWCHVKVPSDYHIFALHNDSIVVHTATRPGAELALRVLREWAERYGVNLAPRELGRTQIAFDPAESGQSFTGWVSRLVAEALREAYISNESRELAMLAVGYTIAIASDPFKWITLPH